MATEIASLFVKIGANVSDLEDGLMRASASINAFGAALQSAGGALTVGITLPLAAVGVAATKSAIELDRSMRNIQSISGQSNESLMDLRDTFLDMSTDISVTTASANELAEGFYQIQSSGFAGADAMQVLEASAMAGSAGLSTTAVAATALTAALNAYGEGADQAANYADVMFKAVDIGVMSFEELSSSLSNVISTAAATGVEFTTVAAAMSTMTKQGMSASEASVSLNQILTSMLKPSEALSEALADIGYESGQAALNAVGLEGVLQALTDAGYDSSTELAELFNNVRALRGVLSLTGAGAGMFSRDLEAMANAAGSTAEAFAIQMQSMKAQLDNFINTAVALGVELFDAAAPAFRDIVKGARDIVEGFRELDPEMQKNIVKWGMIAAAAGPVLTVVGKISTLIGSTIGLVTGLAGALGNLYTSLSAASLGAGGFGGAMAALPLGLVAATAAIGGIVAAMTAYNRQTEDIARQTEEYNKKQAEMKAEATGVIDVVNDEANALGYLGDKTDEVGSGLGDFADAQMQAWRSSQAVAEANEEVADTYDAWADSMAKANAIMDATGLSAADQTATMDYLATTTSSASVEFDRQAATMATLTAAYQAGIISQGLFNEAMAAAVNNTSLLNDEQLAQINNSIASVEAMNLASIAAGEYAQTLYSLAGSFQSATTAIKQGELAMSMLNEAYNNGSITGTQFAEGMQSINDKYGVYSDKALAAAAGTMQLMDAMQAGKIEDFGGAYQKMLENVEGGLDPMAGVMEDFGKATEAAIAPLEDMEDVSVTAEFKTNADTVVDSIIAANNAMQDAVDTSVTHTINIVTVYSTVGSPAAGSPGTMTGVPTISAPTGTPPGPPAPPGYSSSSSSVAPSTSSTAAPSYVSQDTYNIYNPLAAAIISEQKHQDRVAAAEEVLR